MSHLLTRRGFAQLALAAGAGLMVPSAGAAHRGLAARLAVLPGTARLGVELFLRHGGPSAITLAGGSIRLEGVLSSAAGDHPIVLLPEVLVARPMSRAAPARREAPPIVLPPGHERLYSRFWAPWPSALERARGEATLAVRAHLDAERASRPQREREALDALGRVRATTSVTLPA